MSSSVLSVWWLWGKCNDKPRQWSASLLISRCWRWGEFFTSAGGLEPGRRVDVCRDDKHCINYWQNPVDCVWFVFLIKKMTRIKTDNLRKKILLFTFRTDCETRILFLTKSQILQILQATSPFYLFVFLAPSQSPHARDKRGGKKEFKSCERKAKATQSVIGVLDHRLWKCALAQARVAASDRRLLE